MNEKTPAVLTHVLGMFTLFVGPLAMYFAFKGKATPWLREHLDESLNYHILLTVAAVVVIVLAIVLTGAGQSTMALYVFLVLALLVAAHVFFGIMAIVKAARGKAYHFPLDVKIIR
jgi:uncharacterized Tic20 family protein